MRRAHFWLLLLIPLWGAVLWDARDAVQPRVPWLDEHVSLQRATAMAKGHIFVEEGGWVQPPGYPALLALTGADAPPATGVFETAPLVRPWQLAQIVAWFGVAAFLLASGRRALGERWGWLPVAFFALSGEGWMFALRPLPEIWLALAASVLLWGSLDEDPPRRRVLLLGLVAGGASLLRGHAVLLAMPLLLLMLLRRNWRAAATLALGALLPIVPASVVHSARQGVLVGPSSNAGINLHVGNREEANGLYNVDQSYDFARDPAGRSWLRALGRDDSGSLAEIDGEWRSLAFEEMSSNPDRTLGLFLRKAWLQLAALDIPQIDGIAAWRRFVPTLRVFALPFGALSACALLSLLWWRADSSIRTAALSLFLLVGAQAVFFVTGRFRMIFLPQLCLLAALAIPHALERLRERRIAALLVASVACTLFVVPWGLGGVRAALRDGVSANLAARWSQLVAASQLGGHPEQALAQLERWADEDSSLPLDERSGLLFVKLLSEAARHEEALSQADDLARRFPDSPRVSHAQALGYIRAGRASEALQILRAALERFPDDEPLRGLHRRLLEDLDS